MRDPKLVARRAAMRAGYHLLKAVLETVKAVEAVVDEIAGIDEGAADADTPVERLDIE